MREKTSIGPDRPSESFLGKIISKLGGQRETTLTYTPDSVGEVVVPDLEKGLTPLEGYHDTRTFHGFGNRENK